MLGQRHRQREEKELLLQQQQVGNEEEEEDELLTEMELGLGASGSDKIPGSDVFLAAADLLVQRGGFHDSELSQQEREDKMSDIPSLEEEEGPFQEVHSPPNGRTL